MALPNINETPNYEMTIPSSGKGVSFRPFLTKEQKILLIALETQDQRKILSAITDTIKACAPDVDVNKLTTFDVEYAFTQMRAKSVGEKSHVGLKCKECEHQNEVSINLEEIKVDIPEKNNMMVELNDTWTLKMKYPNYVSVLNNDAMVDSESPTNTIMNMIASCMDSLMSEEDNIKFSDESKKTVDDFIDNLNSEQFEKIMNFIQDLPQLKHEVKFVCEKCETENSFMLQGMNDFFA
tara:strand:- start:745 stop:1458 length:714 start_codon:yes stop_codon:yes gene_type:complete